MASLLGPQWLCECNESGGAETLAEASKGAAHHYLTHGDKGPEQALTLFVYKERGVWSHAISTQQQATEIAYPLVEAPAEPVQGYMPDTITDSPQRKGQLHGRFESQWLPGQPIELGSLTMAEANAQFNATVDMMRNEWRNPYRSMTDVLRGN